MKKIFLMLAALASLAVSAQKNEVKLLIRSDDIGSFHAANIACIDAYKNGIGYSTEIMACCSWFPEAVQMLNENPGLDVGVHLMITSEWETCKWMPLTKAPSITDENGYFYPFIWPIEGRPGIAIREHNWKLEEIEAEFRAQIELVKKHLPHVSHASAHMGCDNWDPEVTNMVARLMKEYGIFIDMPEEVKPFPQFQKEGMTDQQRIDAFAKAIENLKPGTYRFIEHPGLDVAEMEVSTSPGKGETAKQRQLVTDMFTSPKVKEAVKKNNVKLINHKDLK